MSNEFTDACESHRIRNCEGKGTDELHTCPFREDINNDSETLCNCCEACTQECSDEI